MSDYAARLAETKTKYPFTRWAKSGLPQYTPAACISFAEVFDHLIQELTTLGESAAEGKKIEAFHEAVVKLNGLNEEDPSLIETGEREDLCELCNILAAAAGIAPEKYGDGEGPASEWRDW